MSGLKIADAALYEVNFLMCIHVTRYRKRSGPLICCVFCTSMSLCMVGAVRFGSPTLFTDAVVIRRNAMLCRLPIHGTGAVEGRRGFALRLPAYFLGLLPGQAVCSHIMCIVHARD